MGYTHYWERRRALPLPQFQVAVDDCRRLCQTLAIPLGDGEGKNKPIFTAAQICFNGHIDSGKLSSYQQAEGLIWPSDTAHGVAAIGEAPAVAGGWGGGPAVTARVLGPDGDGSYETFQIQRVREPRYISDEGRCGWWSGFCKTNYRPYDLCVQACLIVLSQHLGSEQFRVASDGDSRAWNDARDACQHILGYGIDWGEGNLAPVSPTPT